jgi:hypothetical protein
LEPRTVVLFRDLTAVLALVILTGTLFEWRRRHRRSFFQYTVQELLFTVTVCASLLSWWQVNHQRRLAEEKIADRLRAIPGAACWQSYRGPLFLAKPLRWSTFKSPADNLEGLWEDVWGSSAWLGGFRGDFLAVVECSYDASSRDPSSLPPGTDFKRPSSEREEFDCFLSGIRNLPRIEAIDVLRVKKITDADWEAILAHRGLTSLNLSGSHVNDSQRACKKSCVSLGK